MLWSGTDALPGVASVLDKLRSRKKHIMFVTNNASKSRRVLLDRFQQLGIHAELSEVISSASATALYLKEVLKLPEDRKAYVVGMPGIEEELDGVALSTSAARTPRTTCTLKAPTLPHCSRKALWTRAWAPWCAGSTPS